MKRRKILPSSSLSISQSSIILLVCHQEHNTHLLELVACLLELEVVEQEVQEQLLILNLYLDQHSKIVLQAIFLQAFIQALRNKWEVVMEICLLQ